MAIHPTAVVHPEARVHETAEIGPFCVIGAEVEIGARTRLLAHVYVEGPITIGEENIFQPYSSIGSSPQDLKYHGERTETRIGHRNLVREFVTVHRGTEGGGGADLDRRRQPAAGLRARRARLPCAVALHPGARRDARRPRHGRGLGGSRRAQRRAPVLRYRRALLRRRLQRHHTKRDALFAGRHRARRAHLRRQQDRARAARLLERDHPEPAQIVPAADQSGTEHRTGRASASPPKFKATTSVDQLVAIHPGGRAGNREVKYGLIAGGGRFPLMVVSVGEAARP